MKISEIGNIPSISDYIESGVNRRYPINKFSKIKSNIQNEFIKSCSQDQKNNIVGSKPERDSNSTEFYLRYQSGVTISKSELSLKTYNDIKKLNPPKNENDTSRFYTVIEDVENESESLEKTSSYYVVSGKNEVLNYTVIKDHFDMFRKRLLKAYHIGSDREPGELVNLVF
jgi:hypothetical protein